MIVVVGSRFDAAAIELVRTWSSADAVLLSAEDHIAPGWVVAAGDGANDVAVVSGRHVAVADVSGVVTRRPSVLAEELADIHPDDRGYVAAEINAFLVAWLGALRCPVVNRPTPTSLCGPGWGAAHWRAAAARCGFTLARRPAERSHAVVVCGPRVFGARSEATRDSAQALARSAGVTLLEVHLAGSRFLGASACPDLSSDEVRDAVLDELLVGVGSAL